MAHIFFESYYTKSFQYNPWLIAPKRAYHIIGNQNFMKQILMLIIAVYFTSCSNPKSTELKNLLTNHKWVYYPYDKIKSGSKFVTFLRFYENGQCKNFYMSTGREFIPIDGEEELLSGWNYDDDQNTLEIFGNTFDVISITPQYILMIDKRYNSKALLYNISNKHYNDRDGLKLD